MGYQNPARSAEEIDDLAGGVPEGELGPGSVPQPTAKEVAADNSMIEILFMGLLIRGQSSRR